MKELEKKELEKAKKIAELTLKVNSAKRETKTALEHLRIRPVNQNALELKHKVERNQRLQRELDKLIKKGM